MLLSILFLRGSESHRARCTNWRYVKNKNKENSKSKNYSYTERHDNRTWMFAAHLEPVRLHCNHTHKFKKSRSNNAFCTQNPTISSQCWIIHQSTLERIPVSNLDSILLPLDQRPLGVKFSTSANFVEADLSKPSRYTVTGVHGSA